MTDRHENLLPPIGIGALVGLTLGVIVLVLGAILSSKPLDLPAQLHQEHNVAGRVAEPGVPAKDKAESDTPPAVVAGDASQPDDPAEILQRKLRHIAIALHNYHDMHRQFPPKFEDGQPPSKLSWRVGLLPYLEQQPLYDRFRRDEPWDSDHNRKLLELMPDIYRAFDDEEQSTHFKALVGDEMIFREGSRVTLSHCRDGTSNTLLVVYADQPVPWTKPVDIEFDNEKPKQDLGLFEGKIRGVFADGSPIILPGDIPGETIAALATPDGREVIDGHGLHRRYSKLSSAADLSPRGTPDVGAEPKTRPDTVSAEIVEMAQNKLQHLALAVLNFENVNRSLPPRIGRDRQASGLSWRVHILPYLDQLALYEMFHVREPWDSPHNRELLNSMPEAFRLFGDEEFATHFQVFTREGTLFRPGKKTELRHCVDGTSNTLLAVYADKATPWTKPGDIVFNRDLPKAGIGVLNGKFRGVLVDTSPLAVPETIGDEIIRALITPNGGEVVDGHGLYRRYADSRKSRHSEGEQRAALRRLKSISVAMHSYHNSHKRFPPAWAEVPDTPQRRGRPRVSWRVLLLPYLEQQNLFKKYDRGKEWDHPDNLALLPNMPSVYRHESDLAGHRTRIQVFASPGTMFDTEAGPTSGTRRPRGISYRDIPDGSSVTLMVVEAGPEAATPWTQPTALELDVDDPLAALGTLDAKGFACATANGAAKWLTPDIAPDIFRSMVLLSDGK